MNLYEVTIERVYTDEHKAKWPASSGDSESTFPMWATDEAAVRSRWPYVGTHYRDEVAAVHEVVGEALAERRERASRWTERCCELAVLRPCVCRVSFTCPTHGTNCHGSHD